MKRLFPIFSVCLLALAFTACQKEPDYTAADLFGKWAENANPQSFCKFLSKKAPDDAEYYLGYMWDESEDVQESDLTYLGNGYFKWRLTSDQLVEIHKMEEGWADIPKKYTITMLTETSLSYKDEFGKSVAWTRVE